MCRVEEARTLLAQLRTPVTDLKEDLEDKYGYYSFLHELDAESSWIAEKRSLVEQVRCQIQNFFEIIVLKKS